MNNVEKIFSESKSAGDFAYAYFNYLKNVLGKIDKSSIDMLVSELDEVRKKENTIFVIGNGGSASTATTMANDLGFDVLKKSGTDLPIKVMALTDNNSLMTAVSNDVGYENLFLSQLKIHYRKGDALLTISASGNSQNLIKAAEWVKTKGGRIISFLGFSGGKLKDMSDVVIHVPTEPGEYGPVEDAHLIINHILAHWFQYKLKV
jgi:D-sedoheptulose 7-phosphate isomerase